MRIAICGVACNFPGAASPDEFFANLLAGEISMSSPPSNRYLAPYFFSSDRARTGKTVSGEGGWCKKNPLLFDPAFFEISSREAKEMDPQQREVLRLSWECLEDAGVRPDSLRGSDTAVVMGACFSDYRDLQTTSVDHMNAYSMPGNNLGVIANRVSYCLDLHGPSLLVDTACSSALVAAQIAVQAIENGQATSALVGGTQLFFHPGSQVGFSKLGALGHAQRCLSFSEDADGYVRSEGSGVLFFKPLDKAIEDGNRIYCVWEEGQLNQDGNTPSLTQPSGEQQQRIIKNAYARLGVAPTAANCQYVEAHGTGTQAGDVIEANAIGNSFHDPADPTRQICIGSAKSNIGHLEGASASASLIKVALSLYNKKIPPSVGFTKLNPKIDGTKVSVVTSALDWPEPAVAGAPCRASLNSFGFGGSNAHCILTAHSRPTDALKIEGGGGGEGGAAASSASASSCPPYFFPLSAKSKASLSSLGAKWADFVESSPYSIQSLCSYALHRRTQHAMRVAVVAAGKADLAASLRNIVAAGKTEGPVVGGTAITSSAAGAEAPKVFMLFCGQGAQWHAMGSDLLASKDPRFAVFRATMVKCAEYVTKWGSWDLNAHLARAEDDDLVNDTTYSQGACASIQCALTDQWRDWGIVPDAVIGHSVGEIPAAYAAGGLTLEQAVRIAVCRGNIMNRAKGKGRMAAIGLSKTQAEELIDSRKMTGRVVVSNVNSPSQCTISGDQVDIEALVKDLNEKQPEIFLRVLPLKYAFHSHHMEPLVTAMMGDLDWFSPTVEDFTVPFFSIVTGRRFRVKDFSSKYISDSIRLPVLFTSGLAEAYAFFDAKPFITLEVGPHPVLQRYARQCSVEPEKITDPETGLLTVTVPKPKLVGQFQSLAKGSSGAEVMFRSAAGLHCGGIPINPKILLGGGTFAELAPSASPVLDHAPTYAWDEKEFYSVPQEESAVFPTAWVKERTWDHPLLGFRDITASEPRWRQAINISKYPWIKDHVVLDVPVLPMAGFVNIALAVARLYNASGLMRVEVLRALAFPDESPHILETRLNVDTREVTIRTKAGGEWTLHCKCILAPENAKITHPRFEDQEECLENRPLESFYEETHRFAFDFGKSFRQFKYIHRSATACQTQFNIFEEGSEGDSYEWMHPITLDHLVQTPVSTGPRLSQPRMPAFVHRVTVFPDVQLAGKTCYGYSKSQGLPSYTWDCTLFNENKQPMVTFHGLRFDLIGTNPELTPINLEQNTFELGWTDADLPSAIGKDKEDWVVTLVGRTPQDDAALKAVQGFFETEGAKVERVSEIKKAAAAAASSSSSSVVVAVIDSFDAQWTIDLLNGISARGLDSLKNAAFLTRGCLFDCSNVECSPIVGFLRCFRNEHAGFRLLHLDVPELSAGSEEAKFACKLILSDPSGLTIPSPEFDSREDELAVREGSNLKVPSWNPSPSTKFITADKAENFNLEIGKRGILDTLNFQQDQRELVGPEEVEVRVLVTGMNFRDVMIGMGQLTEESVKFGHHKMTFGLEFAGVVNQVGEKVTRFKPGDKIFGQCVRTYRKFVVLHEMLCAHVPPSLSLEQGSSLFICIGTAATCLWDRLRIQKGESVLIHGGAGGVGLFAIQLAKLAGANPIIATASNETKSKVAKDYGATHVFNSRSDSFFDDVLIATEGAGVDCIINSLAVQLLQKTLDLLKPRGRYVDIGKRDISQNSSLGMKILTRNISISAYDMDQMPHDVTWPFVAKVTPYFEDGSMKPIPVTAFSGTKVIDAFRTMQQSKHIGKICVTYYDEDQKEMLVFDRTVFNPRKIYIVTGASQGVGLDIAEFMVERGAKQVALFSRSGIDRYLGRYGYERMMHDYGAKVYPVNVDVADAAAVKAAVEKVRAASGYPIGGVIHAATVYRDVFLAEMKPEDVDASVGPKLRGALNLHEALKACGDVVDFFVSLSSVSAVAGNQGQANYCAANYGLEAFTVWRRNQGLAATVVNLGPVTGVGFLAEADNLRVARALQSRGLYPLTPNQVIEAVFNACRPNDRVPAQRLYCGMNVPKLEQSMPFMARPRFDQVRKQSEVKSGKQSLRELVLAIEDETERQDKLLEICKTNVAKLIDADPASISADQTLSNMGIDSLILSELTAKFQDLFSVKLTLFEVSSADFTLGALASLIMEKMTTAKDEE